MSYEDIRPSLVRLRCIGMKWKSWHFASMELYAIPVQGADVGVVMSEKNKLRGFIHYTTTGGCGAVFPAFSTNKKCAELLCKITLFVES